MKNILTPVVIFFLATAVYSQDNSPYYLDNTYNKVIEYLINSGKIDITHPLNQPFTAGQVYKAIDISKNVDNDDYWSSVLKKDLKRYLPDETPKGRLLLGATGNGSLKQQEDEFDYSIDGTFYGSYNYKNILVWYGYTASSDYLDDTLYFGTTGKLQNKVYGRASTSYMKYNSKYFNVFYGRLSRNFGLTNSVSLIRSPNPYSYDNFSFSLFNKILKYSFSTTRLEDKYGYDIREDSIPQYDWYKRYISFHRLEISFSKNFKFAFSESILYGGKDQAPVPAYINPVNILFLAKMNDRKGLEEGNANALSAIEIYARPFRKMSVYAQFLIDDMDFTKELRSKYPDRIGFTSNIAFADIIPLSQIKLFYTRISNWTYNSFYTYGNYTFYGKSIGFPKNGFENYGIEVDVFKLSKVYFSAILQYQREREQDLETHYDYTKTDFPVGISQNMFGASIDINYIPSVFISSSLGIEYLSVSNYLHIQDNSRSFFNVRLTLRANGVFSIFTKNK